MQLSVLPCPPPLKSLADGTGSTTRRPLSSGPRAPQCACVATPLPGSQRAAQARAGVFTPPRFTPLSCACATLWTELAPARRSPAVGPAGACAVAPESGGGEVVEEE